MGAHIDRVWSHEIAAIRIRQSGAQNLLRMAVRNRREAFGMQIGWRDTFSRQRLAAAEQVHRHEPARSIDRDLAMDRVRAEIEQVSRGVKACQNLGLTDKGGLTGQVHADYRRGLTCWKNNLALQRGLVRPYWAVPASVSAATVTFVRTQRIDRF